ncbi:KR domain-containing protein [Tatlockia micdadei]|uniref:beta-ketoacyl synthase N-terminal-like domain-containing protein n=1 Tax=Legionella micdadei TaxID=451 RepID=UPI00157010C4|nr:beta-ketoacyl synthase N-terminal-like domain-containing protein [Legionella micdadei]NSL18746.1 KR domain-containing protein [Legionella micdadei]
MMMSTDDTKAENASAIAVIGMAGRFPQAENINEFWQNLKEGRDCITRFTEEDLQKEGISKDTIANPRYIKARGILNGIDCFDANFFGLTPAEAALMDPQQRIFLELCWEALEISGYSSLKERSVGVYAGMSDSTYLHHHILNSEEATKTNSPYQISIATSNHFLATKVSYLLNLTGPSVVVNSACSTSLVAVIEACKSLLSYECDLALAGGIAIRVPQKSGYFYQEGGIYSVDGRCRVFDSQSSGTVGSNGGGVVVLKRLEEALQDGDTIDAVIRSFAINNDGATKIGYSAPSIIEQARCIATALLPIDPESISYVEAHGTGTKLGDPVEIAALTKAFRHYTAKKNFCAVGSVKTNIGHTDVAAGIAGLIKTILALKHKTIPASLYFNEPNPGINFTDSPFYVNSKTTAWESGSPRRAGVSSFGIGGTNTHVILEEAPQLSPQQVQQDAFIIPISAKSEMALQQQQKNLLDYLRQNHIDKIALANIAYTLQVGRQTFNFRKVFLCKNAEELISLLQSDNALEIDGSEYKIAKTWQMDGQADWSLIYGEAKLRRVPLPTYPFEKQSFWIHPSPKDKTSSSKPLIYQPYWELAELVDTSSSGNGNWLIFTDRLGVSKKIILHLQNLKNNIIEIKTGKKFRSINSSSYEINPSSKEDYQKLFDCLGKEKAMPDKILYCWGIKDEENNLARVSNDVDSTDFIALTYFAQVFFPNSDNQPSLYIITNYLAHILSEDKIYPGQSLVLGHAAVIPQEFSIPCSVIDLESTKKKMGDETLINSLVKECLSKPETLLVAYRNNLRFTQQVKRYESSNSVGHVHLKEGGVYLLVGGLGNVGIELANYLAANYKAHLILTTRSSIPYMQILQQPGQSGLDTPLIQHLLNIKNCAGSLSIMQADVSNYDEMGEVFNHITTTYKKLDGLFHLAAVIDGSTRVLIKDLTINQVHEQWLAKITGVNILAQLVNEEEIDFCFLFSSVSSILGGVGLSAYAAANNYLNYFAESRRKNEPIKWFSISWDAWKHSVINKNKNLKRAFTLQQGMDVIQHVFNKMDNPNLFITLQNLHDRLNKAIPHPPKKQPTLSPQLFENESIREKIQQLFEESLGKQEIDPNIGFYDLGGDSLAAITLLELIEESCSIRISLNNFLENQSVNKLAELISKQRLMDSSFLINLKPEIITSKALFFLHPIGGTAFCYFDLINYLPPYSCYALQDPAISSNFKQVDFTSLEEMAALYLQEIKRKQPNGPYVLAGYSFGGTLAFEIARQLLAQKEQVEKIFIVDGWAMFSSELHDKERFLMATQRTLAELMVRIPNLLKKKDQLVEILWKRMQLLLSYKPPKLPLNIVLFKAKDILPEYQSIDSVDNHWSLLTTNQVEIHQITGNHSDILRLPGAKEIGVIINKSISQF